MSKSFKEVAAANLEIKAELKTRTKAQRARFTFTEQNTLYISEHIIYQSRGQDKRLSPANQMESAVMKRS
jgi:hypothetical protein